MAMHRPAARRSHGRRSGDPVDPAVFYFGACAGGVWKTDDAGTYWQNISDGQLNTASIGAIAVSDSDPNVIYIGTGEACIRNNVTYGDGVYRSTDAGKTWTHLGLSDTRHISRVRIHPTNSDVVYVAALGHAFGPNEERGIFRSTDAARLGAGAVQERELGSRGPVYGPQQPPHPVRGYLAGAPQPWSLTSGGPESGIYRSTDGGDTWTEITRNKGIAGRADRPRRHRRLPRQGGARIHHVEAEGLRAVPLRRLR